MDDSLFELSQMQNRRQLMGRSALGLGTAALAGLLTADSPFALANDVPDGQDFNGGLHHRATAKRVIYLFMSGGPSQLDLWDYKPKLTEMFNQQLPAHVRNEQRITASS